LNHFHSFFTQFSYPRIHGDLTKFRTEVYGPDGLPTVNAMFLAGSLHHIAKQWQNLTCNPGTVLGTSLAHAQCTTTFETTHMFAVTLALWDFTLQQC